MSRFDLLGLLDSGLFGDILSDLFSEGRRLWLMIGVLGARAIDLTIGTGSQDIASVAYQLLSLVLLCGRLRVFGDCVHEALASLDDHRLPVRRSCTHWLRLASFLAQEPTTLNSIHIYC